MTETAAVQPAPPTRKAWDAYRKLAAWAGLLAAVAVITVMVLFSQQLSGGGQTQATTWGIVLLLTAPAVLAGLISGSRFFGLYAGYAERLDPTAKLSAEDSASGMAATSSTLGDALWGSLIAGIAGSIPAVVGVWTLFGPLSLIMLPILVLIISISWFAGWTIGWLPAVLLSVSVGIIVGSGRRKRFGQRLPWLLVAVLLPLLLVAVAIPILGVRFTEGGGGSWAAILAVAGLAPSGSEFVMGDTLFTIARVAIWVCAVLFAILVVVGTPALLERRGLRRAPDESES